MQPEAPNTELRLAAEHKGLHISRYRSLLWHWVRRWFVPPRRAGFEPLPSVRDRQVALSFAGHATMLIRYPRAAICVDPMLGNWVGGARRAVSSGLAPADLDEVAVILITHLHADHFHLGSLAKLPKSAMLVGPRGLAAAASQLSFSRVLELAPGTDAAFADVSIHAEPVRHGDDIGGLSYVLRHNAGAPSVYVCGDSGYFSGFADIGSRHAPDIACLPIGGFLPLSFRDRHMSPLDAVAAFEDLRSRVMVPTHYGAFALSYEKLDEPLRLLVEVAQQRGIRDRIVAMQAGHSEVFAASMLLAIHPDIQPPRGNALGDFDPSLHDSTLGSAEFVKSSS
jgi:L-ascorbate metabolism protein UlaG (beta-lactamase superfamily)